MWVLKYDIKHECDGLNSKAYLLLISETLDTFQKHNNMMNLNG